MDEGYINRKSQNLERKKKRTREEKSFWEKLGKLENEGNRSIQGKGGTNIQ